METTHTPGPWFAVDYAGSICIQNGPMYEDVDLLCYDSIFSDIEVPTKQTVEANAKLMAAAPELLESLVCVRTFLQKSGINYDNADLYNVVDKLIKKATE